MHNNINKKYQSKIALHGHESSEPKKKIIHSIKAKADFKRTNFEKISDWLTASFGSLTFLILNTVFFIVWLVINAELIPFLPAFDPFPFSLLTTAVSLEAIILAIFVLISQNRTEKVDDLREEISLQVNIIAEKEVTKIMSMIALLLKKQGIDVSQDSEFQKLLKPVSEAELEKSLEKEIF